ncbi:MAG: NAD-binding protein [Thermoanaerobaculia bacterium]
MLRSQKRLLILIGAVFLVLIATALIYMVGMAVLEGQPRGFWQSLEWAAETLSTTGYGSDAAWTHPAMVLFVVVVQFFGVFLIFLIVPVYLIPFLEERFEVRVPSGTTDLEDHVLVYHYGPAVATLLEELELARVPALVIEEEEGAARRVLAKGHQVVLGSLDDGVLERVCLEKARAVVANGTDDENAALTLGSRQLGFKKEILALVEEPFHRKPMMLAGASAVLTPRHILGAALAARASEKVRPTVAGAQQLGRKLKVRELRIPGDSELVGKNLHENRLPERTGVTVIGQWVGGGLVAPAGPEMLIEADGILILAGSEESLVRFEELFRGARAFRRSGPFVVAGCGEVGGKVVELLREFGEEVKVIDRDSTSAADLHGDVLDPQVLSDAGIESAQAVILALDTDTATLFATVILKDLAPDLPVIARVNRAVNVEKIHRAGADFALSISQISSQILARRLLGEEAIAVDPQLKVFKVEGKTFAGRYPAEMGIRARTGCSVIAVERAEQLLVDLGPEFQFLAEDAVYLCGSVRSMRDFFEEFPQPREP